MGGWDCIDVVVSPAMRKSERIVPANLHQKKDKNKFGRIKNIFIFAKQSETI
jgi:hypothetical protein